MIVMVNLSYKKENSNSAYFLGLLRKELDEIQTESYELLWIKDILTRQFADFIEKMKKADAVVFAAPLYVDGLPAQAVRLLERLLEEGKGEIPRIPVYVISNLGFYESSQIAHLLSMVENWCLRMDLRYGGGLAVGAGPMASALRNFSVHKWPHKQLGEGLQKMAEAVSKRTSMENQYCRSGIPRRGYLMAAHYNFGQMAKENGLKVSDIK